MEVDLLRADLVHKATAWLADSNMSQQLDEVRETPLSPATT